MAVERYIVQFQILDEIKLQEEANRHSAEIIKQILEYAEVNNITPDSYGPYTGQKLDKRTGQPIEKTETIVTIIFDLDEMDVDLHGNDPAGEIYAHALKAIKEFPKPIISDHSYREQDSRTLTLIEITA